MNPDVSTITLEQTVGSVLEGVEHLYALQLFNTVLIIAVAVCFLLYRVIKNFY